MGEPPYLRIAADIRGRIERGELRAGDRVPSTRQLTQRYGVAMATATKALSTLRTEGLVQARPGAGTVVSAGDPAPAARDGDLTRPRILRAAVRIADTEGMAAVSMRRIAAGLNVSTMSLYRHVRSREDLELGMVETVCADFPFPDRAPGPWRAAMEFSARLLWTVFTAHPWVAAALSMTRPQVVPALLNYLEWTLGPLRERGVGVDTMMSLYLTLFGYVRSAGLNLAAERLAERDTGLDADQWAQAQEPSLDTVPASGRFPTFGWIVRQDYDFRLDKLFEFGLARLLDGFAVLLGEYP